MNATIVTPLNRRLWDDWNREIARARWEAYDYELRGLPHLPTVQALTDQGLVIREISKRLGCSRSAVQRARRRLREQEAA